jgi:hypothetical protein
MLAGVALRAIYATVFSMNDILVEHIKLLPLPENLTYANRTWLSLLKDSQNMKHIITGLLLTLISTVNREPSGVVFLLMLDSPPNMIKA